MSSKWSFGIKGSQRIAVTPVFVPIHRMSAAGNDLAKSVNCDGADKNQFRIQDGKGWLDSKLRI
jgi:hypothetical protein